jgi:protein disulfide-isomerase
LIAALALTSCARLGIGGKKAAAPTPEPFGPTGIPPQLRTKDPGGDGVPVTPGGNAPTPSETLNITPEEDIVFTDPDNPEAGLPELSTLLTAPKRRGPWEESEILAKQRAAREGKPLLIWFTDSASSPMCKALDQELFTNPDFERWASEKLIRLRIDANARGAKPTGPDQGLDEKITREIDIKQYVARLKKHYKVLGQPSLLLLNPSGEVVGRYRGYKRGQADFTWGLIKHGEAVSANAYKDWRSKLEKKGYREWQDRKDRKVFAKLTGYTNGTLTLIEPDGTRCRTHESKLSDKDQAWIAEQKKIRNLKPQAS